MKQNTWISCAKGVEIEIERIRKEEWVLVDIEGIRTTAKHSCNRKVCIGRKNGYDYTVIEAQPCYRYMELDEKYKKAHRYCKKFIHRLPFTPKRGHHKCKNTKELTKRYIGECKLILYKGGVLEETLAEEIGCDAINIETIGVKKGKDLLHAHDPLMEIRDYYRQMKEICERKRLDNMWVY